MPFSGNLELPRWSTCWSISQCCLNQIVKKDVAGSSPGHISDKLDAALFQRVNLEPVRGNVKGGVYDLTMELYDLQKGKIQLSESEVC